MSSSKSPQASENPKPNKSPDLIVIGDGAPDWSGPLFCHYAGLSGLKVTYVSCENRHERPVSVLHVGNGELKENARLILGDQLSSFLWNFSQSNLQQFLSLSKSTPASMLWFGKGERELALAKASAKASENFHNSGGLLKQGKETFSSVLDEEACLIDNEFFLKSLHPTGSFPCRRVVSIEKQSSMDNKVLLETDSGTKEMSAAIVVILSESIPVELFPSLKDKIIPVTLSSFSFTSLHNEVNSAEGIYSVFNTGIDFAIRQGKKFILGSFRNLFEDKAVGIHKQADPRTLEGVRKYFSSLGWVDAEENPKSYLDVESITCDGLPLVGSLSENPGVYVVAGFAGRKQNFIFEIARLLSQAIAGKSSFDMLSVFSTKRFV